MQVYQITNKITNKIYIGQTIRNLSDRWSVHKNYAKNNTYHTKLSNVMRKYGIENFEIKTIAFCDNIEELNELEEFLIQELDTINNGYNIRYGGGNYKLNSETIQKLKKKKPEGFSTQLSESRKGEGNPMFGKKLSPEVIAKRTKTFIMNGKRKGRKLSPESIAKRTATRIANGSYKSKTKVEM